MGCYDKQRAQRTEQIWTWLYIPCDDKNPPVPDKWIFRAKKVDDEGKELLCKAICVLWGDFQTEFIYFNPEDSLSPAASQESIPSLLCITESEDCEVEGCGVDNACLFGGLDIAIRMKQTTDESWIVIRPWFACFLLKSLYGARQAGRILGNEIHNRRIHRKFMQCSVDTRLFYFCYQGDFIMVCVVVDHIDFAFNNPNMVK